MHGGPASGLQSVSQGNRRGSAKQDRYRLPLHLDVAWLTWPAWSTMTPHASYTCPGRKRRPPDFKPGNNLRHAPDYGKSKVNLGYDALCRSRQSQPSIRIPPLTS